MSARPIGLACLPAWLVLFAAGCGPGVPAAVPVRAAGSSDVAAAVLVAGSSEQRVFDNARRALADALPQVSRTPLRVVSLSAGRDAAGDVLPATLDNIEVAFASAAPAAAACLLFATSHGTPEGLVLTFAEEMLTPARLDAILDRHCAGRPTIAILSACFSGIFAAPPVAAENRIILTAAAGDRPSFGCSDDLTYTYFDDALLDVLPGARRWDELYARLVAVVAAREQALEQRPSRPQAAFGAGVAPDALLGG